MVTELYDESELKSDELTGIAIRDTLLGGVVDAYFGAQGWQGPQGKIGYQGPRGFQGYRGAQGFQGFQGYQGRQGVQGPQGTVGIQGLQGVSGTSGVSGTQGLQGASGAVGASGVQGPQGIQGPQGLQGVQGPQGLQGVQGSQGLQGLQGLQGFQGWQGLQGSTGNQFAEATFGVDGSGTVVTTGDKAWIRVPFNGTITAWEVTADQAGSCVVDVKKSTYAGFPTFASIAGSEKPTLASQQKSQNLVLSTWATALLAGDYLRITVESASVVTKVTVSIAITRS